MDASEVFYALQATNATAVALSTEMQSTPTTATHTATAGILQSTPSSPPILLPPTISSNPIPTTPTTPRTTTHTPREIPTMYILDQMYDDYMDQCKYI